ncbi:transposase family protein [Halomonas sp. NyZ770]|uniref:transposase family protein n=1 Tax=Halomonas sp. NyZ770 TaxID=2883106 RepID=UPI00406BFF4E
MRCHRCGVARESLTWLAPHARMTKRLQQHLEVLLSLLPVKHVAQLTGLHCRAIAVERTDE